MMKAFWKTQRIVVISIASLCPFALNANSHAIPIGAGVEILDLPGANNTVDTPSDGTTDQSRQNIDITFTATLGAGDYMGASWTYQAGQTGSVIPYIARSTGPQTYEILAVGDQEDIDSAGLNVDVTLEFGGSNFTLDATTELFAGIVNPTVAGSQNPIYTNLASGSFMDHDNNADGNLSPAVVGGTVDGFGHANLGRSYAFSIEVVPVLELSGDFNFDTVIDLMDFDILAGNFRNQDTVYEDGDINFDGTIDLEDFVEWRMAFDAFNANGAPAPEPATGLAFALGLLMVGLLRRAPRT